MVTNNQNVNIDYFKSTKKLYTLFYLTKKKDQSHSHTYLSY